MKKKPIILITACFVLLGSAYLLCRGYAYWKVREEIKSEKEMEAYLNEYFGKYDKIEKIRFEERFGALLGSQIIRTKVVITKDNISYEMTPELALNREQHTFSKEINETEWQVLLGIMEKCQLEDWEGQSRYLYEFNGEDPMHLLKNEQIEYVREGNFFNIGLSAIDNGIDENEFDFRSSYDGSMIIDSEPDYYFFKGSSIGDYTNFGVPQNYNEFRQELWDFVIEYTGGEDWRIRLDQVGQEAMYQQFPYMIE